MARRRLHALALVLALVLAACGYAGSVKVAAEPPLPAVQNLRCPAHPLPRATMPSGLPDLAKLTRVESAPLPAGVVDTGHGKAGRQPPLMISDDERTLFRNQVIAAARTSCSLLTIADARRAGYVLSSFNTQGVGIHWTNWSLVNAPFDPARPAMLLFGAAPGARLRLVGFSYWVRSRAEPAGFAGSADKWHRHFGLCFDRQGLLQSEGVRRASLCPGRWLNGSDLWMLHAWIVPGRANEWGLFATLNPQLCARFVADILRCPGVG